MKKKTYIQPSFATYHFAIRPLLDVSIRKTDEPAEKIDNKGQSTSGSTIWGDYWGGGDAM